MPAIGHRGREHRDGLALANAHAKPICHVATAYGAAGTSSVWTFTGSLLP